MKEKTMEKKLVKEPEIPARIKKMRFVPFVRGIASKGTVNTGPKLVVPNQALSLEEIIARFTRNEPLAIGRLDAVFDDEGNVDLEKVKSWDLVDKEAFIEEQKATQRKFELQQKRMKEKAEQAAKEAAVAKALEELRAKESAVSAAQGKVSA